MESIRVKHAESSTILIISNAREHVPQEDLIAVTLINEDVLPWANELLQGFNLFWSDVDEMELSEPGLDSEGIQGTSRNKFLSRLRKMLTRAGKRDSVHRPHLVISRGERHRALRAAIFSARRELIWPRCRAAGRASGKGALLRGLR